MINNLLKLLEKERLVDGMLHVIILFLFVYACITTNGMYFDYCIGWFPIG